jgi:anaerobic selenocysteine-containing dehydrogenase
VLVAVRDDLFVAAIEQFPTETTRYADVVLPATTQLEHLDVLWSWGHQYLTLNRPAVAPRGQSRPNTEIFRMLADAMGFEDKPFGDDDETLLAQYLALPAVVKAKTGLGKVTATAPPGLGAVVAGGGGDGCGCDAGRRRHSGQRRRAVVTPKSTTELIAGGAPRGCALAKRPAAAQRRYRALRRGGRRTGQIQSDHDSSSSLGCHRRRPGGHSGGARQLVELPGARANV